MGNLVAVTGFAHAQPERAEELRTQLLSLATRARKENGCVEFHVHQDIADPNLFVFYEVWLSADDVETHLAQPYMTDFMGSRMQYLEEDIDVFMLSMESPHPSAAA
jgi:quinol monooxygenase YgiN